VRSRVQFCSRSIDGIAVSSPAEGTDDRFICTLRVVRAIPCDALTARSEQRTACFWTRDGLQRNCKNNGRTSRWEGNIKRDFRDRRYSGVVSVYLVLNGGRKRALLKMETKVPFHNLRGICRRYTKCSL
jgi:hypothetical protein